MDKTLADYINRMKALEEKQTIAVNRNVWNDPVLAKQDMYYINPQPADVDSDEKINPYSQH
jgi:hypothetical protein